MNESAQNPEEGLRAYLDAEFTVDGLASPSDERKLLDALEKLPGLRDFGLEDGKLEVTYEPALLTQAQLCAEIQRAGYRVADGITSPASPVADMVEHPEPTIVRGGTTSGSASS